MSVASDMNGILVSLYRYKAWANLELHDALEKFNAERHPEEFKAMLHILDHVNVVDRIFLNRLTGTGSNDFKTTNSENMPSLSELREIVCATDNCYLDFVANVSPERLKQRVHFVFTDGNNGAMSGEEMLLHVVTHGGYHRGSVGQILEGLRIDSPPDSLTKFLHRHEPDRRMRI